MNSHLNIFKTYTKANRTYQLENDLTRALAISLQEDSLFFHEFLKVVFEGTKFYYSLFGALENETNIIINIQERTSQIGDFDHIFAITLSETQMSDFWGSTRNQNYDPICDLTIKVNDILLVIEAKRDSVDCTSQVYNQVLNIIRETDVNITSLEKDKHQKKLTPFDLNWQKLMSIAVRVLSFENSFGAPNRFLKDFVSLIKNHNFRWLPESPISSLQNSNKSGILRRIDSAIIEYEKQNGKITKLPYTDRLGISFLKPWAQELLFNINDKGDLIASIYPGNTKSQGKSLFYTNPLFHKTIRILNEEYPVNKSYHIKFTSFQKYFTGLWFNEDKLKGQLYTTQNFNKYTGRKKRGKQWDEIESVLNNNLNYDWKEQAKWNSLIINSGKNQFDISFGYEIFIQIPFDKLKQLDTTQENLIELTQMIEKIDKGFNNNLLIASP